jgi:hypothetical protein
MAKKYLKIVPVEAVKILATDFNGFDWDGFPFSEAEAWIIKAIQIRTLIPHTRNGTDYAEWDIKTSHGWTSAGPGDYICHGDDGQIWPIDGKTFERIYREVTE